MAVKQNCKILKVNYVKFRKKKSCWFPRQSDVLKWEVHTHLPTANDTCHPVIKGVVEFLENSDQYYKNTGSKF
jgi:hypothetical protein